MQYDVSTPKAYLDALEEDWRKDYLLILRAEIFRHFPDIDEVISYKMLGYRRPGDSELVFHLNAQARHVGLYVGRIDQIDPDGKLLTEFDRGKGCVRLKRRNDPASPGLTAFIAQAAKIARAGGDIGC